MQNNQSTIKARFSALFNQSALKVGTLAVGVLYSANVWAADYNVKTVTAEINKGEAPVAAVAAATISLLVVRRVWKIIKGSI